MIIMSYSLGGKERLSMLLAFPCHMTTFKGYQTMLLMLHTKKAIKKNNVTKFGIKKMNTRMYEN